MSRLHQFDALHRDRARGAASRAQAAADATSLVLDNFLLVTNSTNRYGCVVEPLERKHRWDPLFVGSILLVARAPGLKLVMLIMSRVFLAPLVAFHFHACASSCGTFSSCRPFDPIIFCICSCSALRCSTSLVKAAATASSFLSAGALFISATSLSSSAS